MRKIIAGAAAERPTAYRQVRDRETGKWRRAARGERRSATDRYRAQAQARLHDGTLVNVDMVGKTADAIERAAQDRLNALVTASNPERERPTATVAALALAWLGDPVQARWASSTQALYAHSVRRWLVPDDEAARPALASLMAHDVEPQDVTAWLHEVAVLGGVETADTARSCLSNVFKFALAGRFVRSNPTRDAQAPDRRVVAADRERRAKSGAEVRRRRGPSEALDSARAFTVQELSRVLIAAEVTPWAIDEDLADLALFLNGLNVRVGAALATVWDDLDLDGSAAWAREDHLDPERSWYRTGEHTITRVAGVGLVRAEYGETKRKQRTLGVPSWLADALLVRRDRMAGRSAFVFDNPLQHGVAREVSRTTKLFRRLFDGVLDDDGLPMVWASSHTFRRTGITTLHEAGVPDRTIADHSGHRRLQVLQDHYLARRRVSTTAADLLPAPRSSRAFQ